MRIMTWKHLLRRPGDPSPAASSPTPAPAPALAHSSQRLPYTARLAAARRRSLDLDAAAAAAAGSSASAAAMALGRRRKSIDLVRGVVRWWGDADAQLADRSDAPPPDGGAGVPAAGGEGVCRVAGSADDFRDDDDFSSQASTHASRDPFLNDASSIPMSSAGDLDSRTKSDDAGAGEGEGEGEGEGVERPDFFSDMPPTHVPLTMQKSRRRERGIVKERERSRSSSALSVRTRSWAPVAGSRRASTEVVGLIGIGSSDVDLFGEEASRIGFVDDDGSVLSSAVTGGGGGGDGGRDMSTGGGGGTVEMSVGTEEESASFQPMSTYGGDPMRCTNSRTLHTSASSMQRRSALSRASKATVTNHAAVQSPHEVATLGIVTHCETAVREKRADAAVRLVRAVDDQILVVKDEMQMARDVLLETREKTLALATARLPEYEQLLYNGELSPIFESGQATAIRAEDEAVFEEFRLSRAVWDIEEAVYERQWHDAVRMVESVRREHRSLLEDARCVADVTSSSGRDGKKKDRFAESRAGFFVALSLLSSEIVAFLLDPSNVLDVPVYVPLLIRLKLEDEARQTLLLSGSTALTLALDRIRGKGVAGRDLADRKKFVTSVTAYLFAQLCESCSALGEVPGLGSPTDEAAFVRWAVSLIDTTYARYLQPVLESKDMDVFEMAQLVSALRKATLTAVASDRVAEVGMIFDSRLFHLIRGEIFAAVSRYQSAFASRASALGSLPVAKWSGSPLRSSQVFVKELETFVGRVALEVLGIDSGIDRLLASVFAVTCSVYASNLLHVKKKAQRRSVGKKTEHRLSRALSDTASKTLEALSDALVSAASVDRTLGSNGSILWIVSQLKDGAHCEEDRLRQVGLASVPKRSRPIPTFRTRKASRVDAQSVPARTALKSSFGLGSLSSERLDTVAAREIVRNILDKERRHLAL